MEEEMKEMSEILKKKPIQLAFRYGLLGAIIIAIYTLILLYTGNEYTRGLNYGHVLFPMILIVFCFREYKKTYGRMSFGEGFRLGLLMYMFTVLFGIGFFLLHIYVINPGFTDGLMEMTRDRMEDRGLDDEQIEQALRYSGYFMTTQAMVIMRILAAVVWGSIISAIASAIMKTREAAL